MSENDDSKKPRATEAVETTDATDDDGWAAVAPLAPKRTDQPSPPAEPATDDTGQANVTALASNTAALDDDWSTPPRHAHPATGGASSAAVDSLPSTPPGPTTGRQTAGSPPTPAPPAEPTRDAPEPDSEPDYGAEARQWRESLNSAVGVHPEPRTKSATHKTAKASKQRSSRAQRKTARRGSAGADSSGSRGGGDRASSDDAARKRIVAMAIGAGIAVVLIGSIVGLGWFNSRDYYLICGTDTLSAERGNSFPPWGTSELSGSEWSAISLPGDTECTELVTSDKAELEDAFLKALVARANTALASEASTRSAANRAATVDAAEKQLRQALLLSRSPERRNTRSQIQRLLGDVEYWHADARRLAAIQALRDAADGFDKAANDTPRHQNDAGSWARYARHLADELERGPSELRPEKTTSVTGDDADQSTHSTAAVLDAGISAPPRIDAQPGIALPPTQPTPDAGTKPAARHVDASLPSGGVLL